MYYFKEKELIKLIEDGDEHAIEELNKVTDELKAIKADTADSRARRILAVNFILYL